MVVRLHNLDKWSKLEPGEALDLPGEVARRVLLNVNAAAPTTVEMLADGAVFFLCVFQGLEVIDFVAQPKSQLVFTSESDVWFFTDDGGVGAIDLGDVQSFTKVAQRRARNPELERMMFKLEQNMSRRLATQAEEAAAYRKLMLDKGIDPDTGEEIDNGDGDAASPGGAGGDAVSSIGEPAKPAAGAGDGQPAS